MLKRGERIGEGETIEQDEWDVFYEDYCPKCSWKASCEEVDPLRMRRLDDGRLSCTRYRCGAVDW